jgi:N-acetylgalactosamine-N,N'-diacetylbacillosaminyl-diphospho-undecaprenol 4-alpha-N-acetylgalactosaminyltransferase
MKKTLSILIYSLGSGGAERQVSILLKELHNKYNITLVLMNDTIFYEIPENVEVIFLEKSKPFENGIKKLLKLPFLGYKYSKIESDVSLSFMNRPNYINVFSKIFGKKSKFILSERIAPSQEYKTNFLKDRISRFLIRKLYKKADLIIPNADGIKFDLINNFKIYENIIKTIYNPINLEKIENLKNEENDIKFDKFSFITIGRLEKQKNHNLLIESFSKLKIDAKLYIIGEGELREELELKIEKLNLTDKVFLLGIQKNPYKFLNNADCFVFSSNYEGFPNVLLEALACGLPIISTDCLSGPREILAPRSEYKNIKDIEIAKYGILVPVNNAEKLAKAMKVIYEDNELRYNFKNKAKKRAKDFEVKKIIKEWKKIIGE